jgi:hypothetical protein
MSAFLPVFFERVLFVSNRKPHEAAIQVQIGTFSAARDARAPGFELAKKSQPRLAAGRGILPGQ